MSAMAYASVSEPTVSISSFWGKQEYISSREILTKYNMYVRSTNGMIWIFYDSWMTSAQETHPL